LGVKLKKILKENDPKNLKILEGTSKEDRERVYHFPK